MGGGELHDEGAGYGAWGEQLTCRGQDGWGGKGNGGRKGVRV